MKTKVGVAILIWDKIDFKKKAIIRTYNKAIKEGHFIRVKGAIQHEDITLVNICAHNIDVLKHKKQIMMDRERLTVVQS